jgi:hypothetical protein
MYHVVDDVNQQFPLTIPAVFGDAHYYAYNALIAKDVDLGPTEVVVSGDTIYLHLVESSGPSSAPQNPNLAPTSIDIDGVSATYLGRFNQADIYDRYWVKCTLPDTASVSVNSIVTVTFTNVPMGNATRVLAVTEIIDVP